MKRFTLGFVIVTIVTISFFMHRASIKGVDSATTASKAIPSGALLSPLVIAVDNQSDKNVTLVGIYKSSIVKPGETLKSVSRTEVIKAKSKRTVIFPSEPGFDRLEVIKQQDGPVVPLHTISRPLTAQSIVIK